MYWKTSYSTLLGLIAGSSLIALLPDDTLFQHKSADELALASASTGERWACPMMDFIGDKSGSCPVCGMNLTMVLAGELTKEQASRIGLQTTIVTAGPALATVRAYGAVRYDERTARPVITRVPGRVVKRHAGALHEGTKVATGDALLDLYSPEVFSAQGELAAALKLGNQSTALALEARFERWNLADVAAAIRAGSSPVDTVTIRSPFSGQSATAGSMNLKMPEVGQEVTADREIVRLLDPTAYMIAVHVPETRAHWIRVGQPVRLASDDMGELPELAALISWVAPGLDMEIRAREIHLHVQDVAGHLLPGSLINARFQVALAPDLTPANPTDKTTWGSFTLIPKTAVLSTGVRNVAWKISERSRDGNVKFSLAALALGPRLEDENGNDFYVVRAGLSPGDEVATQGLFLIDSQAQLAGTPSLLFPTGANAPVSSHQH